MAIIITAPVTGSLRINNSSASPTTNVLCNLSTVNVVGDVFQQAVNIQNNLGQVLQVIPLKSLTSVGASGSISTLQNAIDAISSLIMK